jgi:predicted ATPase with chaperone activity
LDDASLPGELVQLRRLLPPQTAIIAGGRAASAYGEALERVGALLIEDLEDFSRTLDRLRQPQEQAQGA